MYVHTSLIKKWDLCAGHAILRAMGGILSSLIDPSSEAIGYHSKEEYKVENGLLATMSNHQAYFDKLKVLVGSANVRRRR